MRPGIPLPDPKSHAYALKVAAVQLSSGGPRHQDNSRGLSRAQTLCGSREALYGEGTAAYVDAVSIAGETDGEPLAEVMARHDPDAMLARRSAAPRGREGREPGDCRAPVGETGRLGLTFRAGNESFTAALRAAASLNFILAGEVVTSDPATLHWHSGSTLGTWRPRYPWRDLFKRTTSSTYMRFWGGADAGGTLQVEMEDAAGKRPMLRDLLTDRTGRLPAFPTGTPQRRRPDTASHGTRRLRSRFQPGCDRELREPVQISGRALPAVAEIVARHQQAQATQDAVVGDYVGARNGAALPAQRHRPGFDVVTENRFYFDREGAGVGRAELHR